MKNHQLIWAGLAVLLMGPGLCPADDERSDAREEVTATTIESGFLFADGQYLQPPYTLTTTEDGSGVLVNGEPLPGVFSQRGRGQTGEQTPRAWQEDDDEYEIGRGRGRNGGRDPGRILPPGQLAIRRIDRCLNDGGIVVAFTDQPLFIKFSVFGYPFFSSLLNPDPTSDEYQELMAEVPKDAAPLWETWLQSYKAPSDLRKQAQVIIDDFDKQLAENEAKIVAVQRFDFVAYPLTVLGMVIGVLALGHLLMSLPNRTVINQESTVSVDIVRATMISLSLIAVLSGFDLVWTILASQAGQMKELNPIGGRFITDPNALIAFKFAATFLGCGLLYAMRRHDRAQMASWWLCLVCTVLTFRWVMFNSMFVA